MTAREINRLIREGTYMVGIYVQDGQWVTGRLGRVRRLRRSLAWEAQPWETTGWRELKSPRQVWVQREEETPAR